MLKNKIKSTTIKRRAGSLIGENACVLLVLFFFIFFPLLDLGAFGLRTFFLWFACNQAAMAGSKGNKWSTGTVNDSTGPTYSIQTQALTAASNVVNGFSGITISSGYPKISVILRAILHSDTTANQPSASTITYTNGSGLPLATPPDSSQYVPFLQVQIIGTVKPFIQVPFFPGIPGLSTPVTLTIFTEQQLEDINALTS